MFSQKNIAFIIAIFTASVCHAQNLEWVENKGQWNNTVTFKGELNNGAFFLQPNGYKVVQHSDADLKAVHKLMHGGDEPPTEISNIISKNLQRDLPTNETVTLHSHAYQASFKGANPQPQIVPEKQQQGYNNYFKGNDPTKWAGNCNIYGSILYKNMYPGIDVRYYSDKGHLKYDIVVQPNADASNLALQYDGVNSLSIKNKELVIGTSVGNVKEQFPYSFQLVNGERSQVDCKYQIDGNVVHYKLGNYDRSKILVIDPTEIFCSFTGTSTDNWGYTATYGPGGALFGGGIVFGTGFPVNNGAYQTGFGGGGIGGEQAGYDIGIIKYNSTGTQRVYATYVGGSGNEAPHSMITDAQGNLIVAGRTNSTNFPTLTANIGPAGGANTNWHIILFKLNAAGSALLGSVKIGGSNDDGVNIRNKYPNPQATSLQQNYGEDSRSEVILSGTDILLASCTQSTDFPVTANAAQGAKGLAQDGVFIRMNNSLTTMIYSTFIGGSNDDAAYVISASPITGNIFVGGGTASNDLPGDHSNTVGTAFNGGALDGFVNEYTPGGILLKSAYIGTSGDEQVYGLKFDIYGFPYVMGTSTGNFPVANAAYSVAGGKQFIGKLQKDLSGYVYSTVFGPSSPVSKPNISPIAFLVDKCENVYISGWGGTVVNSSIPFPNAGTQGLPVTANAIQSSTDGRDMYFFVLEKNAASQLYGTFFGQNGGATDHVDGGTSRFDDQGVIYQAICANCGGSVPFPVTPNVYGPANLSRGACNEAFVKIEFNFAGTHAGVKTSINATDGDTSGCVPLQIDFRDTVALAQQYIWNFGDGTAISTTTTPNISHVYNAVGTYRVMLIGVDSSKCFPRDTSYVNVRIRQDQAPISGFATKLPPCTSTTYQFTNTSMPYPGKSFSNNSFRWIWGDNSPDVIAGLNPTINHVYPGVGTYNVKLVLEDTNFCNSPDTFRLTVRISPNIKASFTTPASGCAPYNAVFNNTSLGGISFFWDFGDGNTSTLSNPSNFYNTPGTYLVKLLVKDSTSCNFIDSTSFSLTVSGKPTSGFSYSPNPAQENVITTFTNLSINATHYKWLYGDGDTLQTFRHDTTVRHQYNETKLYTPCLVAINQFGCPDTSCQALNAIVKPILDVPNAFTPNGDGANDRAVVIGIGITQITFRIYNRWGQVVFETNDRKQGWDGKFKGQPQPMDVYGYTLDVIFFDGKTQRKSGDITLIR